MLRVYTMNWKGRRFSVVGGLGTGKVLPDQTCVSTRRKSRRRTDIIFLLLLLFICPSPNALPVHSVSYPRHIRTEKTVENRLRWILQRFSCIQYTRLIKIKPHIPFIPFCRISFIRSIRGRIELMCARDRVCIVYNIYNGKSFPSKITGIFLNRHVIASLLIRRADQTKISWKISYAVITTLHTMSYDIKYKCTIL